MIARALLYTRMVVCGRDEWGMGAACFVLAIIVSACGGKSTQPDNHPSTGQGGSAGSAATSGSGNSAAGSGTNGGAAPETILAPLATDDATIDAKSGAELLELAMNIGYAEGYAQCTCLPKEPVADLDGCARAESRFELLFEPAVARCVVEQGREVAGFDELLRCKAKSTRSLGRHYANCPDGTDTKGAGPEPPYNCSAADDVWQLASGSPCRDAFSCDDGTFLHAGHCDFHRDCPDSSDERGCGDFVCGDQLLSPWDACNPDACSVDFSPPLCSGAEPLRAQCGDGTEVSVGQLCNQVQDCSTGRDEQYCF